MVKTLVMIVDGGSYSFFKGFSHDKDSVFKRFAERGIFTVLESTLPPLTCPAIPCFYTGKNAGKTGISSFTTPAGKVVNSSFLKERPVWEILNDHGLKTCVYYMPITYPPKPLDGVLVTGYGTPYGVKDFVWPREVLSSYDLPTPDEEHKFTTTNVPEEIHLDNMKGLSARKFDSLKRLEQDNGFDVTFFFLEDSDVAQHFLFHRKDLLEDYFSQISHLLERLMADVRYDNVIIMSDHGFHSTSRYEFYTNAWLAKSGYLTLIGGPVGKRLIPFAYSLGQEYLPLKYISRLKSLLFRLGSFSRQDKKKSDSAGPDPAISDSMDLPIFGVDKTASKAYSYYNWGIYISKTVKGDSYNSLRAELIKRLKALKSSEGGQIFRQVLPKEQIFSGKYIENLPDIILLPYPDYDTYVYLSDKVLRRKKDFKRINGRLFTGHHDYDPEGILFMHGKDFKRKRLPSASIMDITPTLLNMYGITADPDMDGKVLDVFKPGFKPRKRKLSNHSRGNDNSEKNRLDSVISGLKI